VIADFLDSWALFHDAYLVGWMIAVLLSLQGIVIVARDQIFIGAAVSQAAALGIALGMVIGSSLSDSPIDPFHAHASLSTAAIAAAVVAALATTGERASASFEAITGWVFLFASSFSILILAHSPHGLEEIHHLLSSSIIGATSNDVWLFGTITTVTIAVLAWRREAITLFMMDAPVAAALGVPVRTWSRLFAVAIGVSIGLSMRSSGLLFSFGCLALPALIATQLCRECRSLFWVAPAVALATTVVGFVVANHYDFPPAQMAVAIQSAVLACLWGLGLRRSS
jgi:ABC-type Mn2+/Zn2+ transport system permease subunit